MRFTLTAPMMITARLLPGVKIGDSFLSVQPISREGNRFTVAYWIDTPDGEIYSATDVSVVSGPSDVAREAVRTVCAFLSADAEAYMGSGEMGTREPTDGYVFGVKVAEWAYMNDAEIADLACESDDF